MATEENITLRNQTRGLVLATPELATSPWRRLKGLMGRRALDPDGGLILDPGNGIHMFFMRFAVDAVFVDREWRVLHIAREIKPWRMSRLVRKSKRVVELPAGTCRRTGTEVGDVLTLG